MAYVFRETQLGEPIDARELPSLTSEVLTETFAEAFETNPVAAILRSKELADDYRTGRRIDADTARQRLSERGLEGDITVSDAGITEAALNTLMFRKEVEKRRQEVFAQAEGGFGQGAARLGLALGTSLIDPLNVVTAFIPVVGEARYAKLLGSAGGALGRTGVRAGVGAAEGVAGAALLEPIIAGSKRFEQADYDMADSLLNVGFGGLFGAGLHTTFGAVSDGVRAYRDGRVVEVPTLTDVVDMPTREAPVSRIDRQPGLSGEFREIETRFADQVESDVDAAIAEYAKLEDTRGGKVLNTDTARELSADYRADRTKSAAVHEPASWLVKEMYNRLLAKPPKSNIVLFTAGGAGAGKSSGLQLMPGIEDRADIVFDTNMNTKSSAVKKIDQALASGREVQIVYTLRDPIEALQKGALPRAMRMGRTVPLDQHAETHVGAADTIKALAEKYKDDPRVNIRIVDNRYGKNGARMGSVADVPTFDYNQVVGKLYEALEAEYKAGRISEAVYNGTKGAAGRADGEGTGGPDGAVDRGQLEQERSGRPLDPIGRETALKQAVVDGVTDKPVNPSADAQELASAMKSAEQVLAREPDTGTPTADALKMATDEAALAQSDLKALADRLGADAEDAELRGVLEAAATSERWAKAAELATVCLTRAA